jgi:hypothetical protein
MKSIAEIARSSGEPELTMRSYLGYTFKAGGLRYELVGITLESLAERKCSSDRSVIRVYRDNGMELSYAELPMFVCRPVWTAKYRKPHPKFRKALAESLIKFVPPERCMLPPRVLAEKVC